MSVLDDNEILHAKQLAEIDILEKKQKELKKLDDSNNSEI